MCTYLSINEEEALSSNNFSLSLSFIRSWMISLQVKTHPKKHLLIIPSVLDDFIPGENPPEEHILIIPSVLDNFILGENPPEEHILILLSVLDAFTSSEIPPERISYDPK